MTTHFYNPKMFAAEHEIAAYIHRLLRRGCDRIEPMLDNLEGDQLRAVETACRYPVSIMYGCPGTGKTTTSNMIVRSLDRAGLRGMIVAPTGKAAKRANEVIYASDLPLNNALECLTVHRALKFSPHKDDFVHDHKNFLDVDYLGIEEASMLDCPLTARLLSAVDPDRTRVFFLGDPYQLPSVGPGNILHDLIHSGVVPKVELTKIFRQGANSGIVQNARRILGGEMPIKEDPITGELFKDWYYVPRSTPEKSLDFILESVCEKLPANRNLDPIMDIQVLSPGKKSDVGTIVLNKKLRDRLNPVKDKNSGYEGFYTNDKVINRQNVKQLGIVNGDIGKVIEVGKCGMTIDFGPGAGNDGTGIVEFSEEKEHAGGSIQLAYCFTIHSSQGSEFKAVLIPCHMAHYKLLFRNLVYTGVTRAKILSCVVGDIQALSHAIETSVTDKRITGLQVLLRKNAPKI